MPPPLSMWVQRTMSAEVNPSLVNWLTSMMSMRLQVILEHNPVTEQHIQHYVVRPRQVRPRDSCARYRRRGPTWAHGHWYRGRVVCAESVVPAGPGRRGHIAQPSLFRLISDLVKARLSTIVMSWVGPDCYRVPADP